MIMTCRAHLILRRTTILFVLLVIGRVESLLTSLPRASILHTSIRLGPQSCNRRCSVTLSMGIRSIIRKLAKDGNDDNGPPRRIRPVLPTIFDEDFDQELQQQEEEVEEEMIQQRLTPAPLRMGETSPGSGVVDAAKITEDESIQDKINRVKSGQMTEEEKRAFLATALSAGMTPESRKPLIPPKRMENTSASPFPTDSILRNFVSGKVKQQKKDVNLSSVTLNLNTDAKKKEYLDLVTDPNRFTRRIKPKSNSGTTTNSPLSTPPVAYPAPSPPAASWPEMAKQTNGNAGGVDDLGARLGVYAMEEEVRRREMEKQRAQEKQEREERERFSAQQKQEADQRAAEVARRQQLALKQVEEQSRRKEQEDDVRRKEEESAAEQQRLAALIQQQEAYWTERLAREKEAKAKREQAALQESKQQKEQIFEFPSDNMTQPSRTSDSNHTPAEDTGHPSHQREVFNPNEMDLLEEAQHNRETDWDRNQQAIQWGTTHTPGLEPPTVISSAKKMQSESDFLEEQARKKAEIDRAREEQFLRLKEMNSPLPAPVVRAPAPAPSARPSSLFRPPHPGPTTYRPTTSTIQDIQEASKNAEMHKRQDAQRSQPLPPLTRPSPPRPLTEKEWTGQPRPDLFGRPTGGVGYSRQSPPSPPPPSPPKNAQPERKGPIRMELPVEEPEEDGVDVKSNNGMSIADAMRNVNQQTEGGDQSKRSKQWGVDMSRFL